MEDILTGYEINQATWFYHSLLLMLAVFFKFNRLWSLRNLDLLLLLSLSPGLILVKLGADFAQSGDPRASSTEIMGYAWLFSVTGLLVVRLLFDGALKRRPRLEQNLNSQGMLFLGIAAFGFLMTEAVIESPPGLTNKSSDLVASVPEDGSGGGQTPDQKSVTPPTLQVIESTSQSLSQQVGTDPDDSYAIQLLAARLTAIAAHMAVICGLFVVGSRLFGDLQLGLSMGLMYLLLPCTAFDVHKADHVIPAALIVWAIAAYRKPLVSGALLGLACGAVMFPIFLLPLWVSFYGRRGGLKFIVSLLATGAILVASLTLSQVASYHVTREILGKIVTDVLALGREGDTTGFWALIADSWHYRLPVFIAYLIVIVMLTLRRGQRTLEHLIADSTLVVVGTQLWYPQSGGVHLLWYLPLLLMVVFRPRLMHLLPPQVEPEKSASVKLLPQQQPAKLAGQRGANQILR